jgi:FkbM family methyltransferase
LRVSSRGVSQPVSNIPHDFLKTTQPLLYQEIFIDNAYGVESQDILGKVLIDVGANIGVFSMFASLFQPSKIYAVEAQPYIFNYGLKPLMAEFKNVICENYAMFSSDGLTVRIPNNHVGSQINFQQGEEVETIRLDSFISKHQITDNNMALKLDCEGSEFDIIMSSSNEILRRFSTIFIEMHDNSNPELIYQDMTILKKKFFDLGFICVKNTSINDSIEVLKYHRS